MPELVIQPQVLLMMKFKHVMQYFPDWKFNWESEEDAYFEGWVRTGVGQNRYQLRLCFNPKSPEVCPKLYVWDPIILPAYQSGTINDTTGHSTHTISNGPGGRVQICHGAEADWDASVSLILPILRGILWLYAYEGHRATGKLISEYFPE
jgi:hypothetical protein